MRLARLALAGAMLAGGMAQAALAGAPVIADAGAGAASNSNSSSGSSSSPSPDVGANDSAGAGARAGASTDARTALRVGDWRLSAPALALLGRVARARQPAASAVAVAAAALEDRVVGEYARASVGDDALFDNRFVALTPEASAEASLYASIESAWHVELAAAFAKDGGLGHVVRRHPLSPERLRALLGAGAKPRLDDRLPPAREAALVDVVLLEWRIDARDTGRATLADVWRRLTLQERNALYNGDAPYAMHQAEELARRAELRHWASVHAGLDDADFDALLALVADHDRRIAFARWSGAIAEDHFHSAELERLRKEVSDDDVQRWYAAHPDAFRRTERVRARHVHCADEARCDAASAALKRGQAFADVARRSSDAPDAAAGGDLGWIDAERARHEWLAQLAFALPPGPPADPLRAPGAVGTDGTGGADGAHGAHGMDGMDGADKAHGTDGMHVPDKPHGADGGWEIVQVLERVQGRHPADSEAVRFGASGAIARERAVGRYGELRARLLAQADVTLAPALLGFGPDALAAAEAAR